MLQYSLMTSPVSPGDVIDGNYVIERLLGQGGMGAVFVAREERLGRSVAIKVLLNDVAKNPEAVTRFEREARSAAALQSDHVTRVLSVGHLASGAPYIVMELLEGEDLAGALKRRGPLPFQEVVGFMAHACEALAEAHSLGIVHRDLKPANIFLARRPSGAPRVKVLDFGISKAIAAASSKALTSTTALMGTPLYMSPEQLREARNVDGRADVWALGVVMYELLAGELPFKSEALAELCVLIMTTAPAPLSSRRPGIPPALEAIVHRCLEKDPAARFASANDLMAALSSVGSLLAASPPHVGASAGQATEAIGARGRAQAPTEGVRAQLQMGPTQGLPQTGPTYGIPQQGFPQTPAHGIPPQGFPQTPAHGIPLTGPTQGLPQAAPYWQPQAGTARMDPQPVTAGTIDAVSNTQMGLPRKRPHALALILVAGTTLALGAAGAWFVLSPKTTPHGTSATAAGSASTGEDSSKTATSASGHASSAEGSSSAASSGTALRFSPLSPPSPPSPLSPPSAHPPGTPRPPAPIGLAPAPGGQAPPGALPPPVALPPPGGVPSPPGVVSAPPSARPAPSTQPLQAPAPNPGSLMPGTRTN